MRKVDYKRLTENEFDCSRCKDRKCTIPDAYCCDRLRCEIYNRLADLEDKIENGTLAELPCKGIEELDIIKKGMIFIFYKMCLEQNLGQGVFLKYKSKINEWFKSYLKNKELQEEQE